jgi:hypothetical protein
MRNINFRLFSVVAVVLAIATYFSFMAAYDADEGKPLTSGLARLLSELFNILRFPTHVLLPELTKASLYFALGLAVNCFLYSLLIERIVYYAFFRKHIEEDAAQDTPVDL